MAQAAWRPFLDEDSRVPVVNRAKTRSNRPNAMSPLAQQSNVFRCMRRFMSIDRKKRQQHRLQSAKGANETEVKLMIARAHYADIVAPELKMLWSQGCPADLGLP